jgi:Cof subfamily protein (haloacid dehalogenase superfamily)
MLVMQVFIKVKMKGIIALDIDGTITHEHHAISKEVVKFLEELASDGWNLIFVTGRPFKWGYEVLQNLHCPYYFSVQNGAITLKMPERKVMAKKYLDKSIFPQMIEAVQNEPSDFVIYTGFENHDRCFYRPEHFSKELLNYLNERVRQLDELWIPLDSFDHFDIPEFASIKAFGTLESANRIANHIKTSLNLHIPLIRDPFSDVYYVAQATHSRVNKGFAVQDYRQQFSHQPIVIAAGDDNNDRSMLEVADIRVVMATAPEDIRKMAHVLAPPASENGIIPGLTEAIKMRSR